MDGDVALVVSWTSGLNLVAMALLGVAWLTLVVGLRWRWRTKAVAALPGLATLAVAVAGAVTIGDARQAASRHAEYSGPLLMGLVGFFELLAVVALVWIFCVATRGSRSPHRPPAGGCAVGYDGVWFRSRDH